MRAFLEEISVHFLLVESNRKGVWPEKVNRSRPSLVLPIRTPALVGAKETTISSSLISARTETNGVSEEGLKVNLVVTPLSPTAL